MTKNRNVLQRPHGLWWALSIGVMVALGPANGFCTAVTKATVEDCTLSEQGMDCAEKDVLTFAVGSGDEVTLDLVTTKLTQKDGVQVPLEETYRVAASKSQPQVRYPLSFVHTVAYFPYEEAICAEELGCDDAADSLNPSCGWTYQGSQQIRHSQGFCADSTAHCLRLGELYFHGYEIGRPSTMFEIGLDVTRGNEMLQFVLSPADQIYNHAYAASYDGSFELKAEIVGELEGYEEIPDLGNYILYIPASPDTHPFVRDYQNNMLLVPREEVSLDGGECDKVGVSFYTFRAQEAKRNTREIGDCLHNQLFHKHNSDLQKLISNPDAETTYLVHGQKIFKGAMAFQPGMEKILEYRPASTDEKSLVALTMDIETVKVVNTESLGIIKEAWVKTFKAMSKEGTMVVEVENYGDMKTDYNVSVTGCNMNIDHAIPQQSVTLDPAGGHTLFFDINTLFNIDTTNECMVTLKGSTGRVYDSVSVVFDSNKHYSDYSWDLQMQNEDGTGEVCLPCADENGDGICDADDTDADGVVNDDDSCPATPAGEIVDASGCSITDLCPCDGDWRSHGSYVICVARTARNFRLAGLINGHEKGAIIMAAARSECGRKKKK